MARMVGSASAVSALSHAARSRVAVREALRSGRTDESAPSAVASPSAAGAAGFAAAPELARAASKGSVAEDPKRFLLRFGYTPESRPELGIAVDGREEEEGHTLYLISCTMRRSPEPGSSSGRFSSTAWSVKHRLCDLRAVHDVVKEALGPESYELHFGATHFARHGGVPGTTARLKGWFASLAACMNSGVVEAQVLAHVLRFLEAPLPEDSDAVVKRADQAALRALGRCMVCTVAIGPHETEGLCLRCLVLQANAKRRSAVQSQQQQPQQQPRPQPQPQDEELDAAPFPHFEGSGAPLSAVAEM